MPLNLASPGILVREFDLTTGGVRPSEAITAAQVAPFAKGPVLDPTLIQNENELLNIFGEPYSVDYHYEHWLSASSYLAYGGNMLIVRSDDADLRNANVSVAGTTANIKIKSLDHYNQLNYDENVIPGTFFTAQNPGSWANGIRVAIIDSKADQILGVTTTGVGSYVGLGVTQSMTKVSAGIGVTTVLDGYLKGVITGVSTTSTGGTLAVKVLSHINGSGVETNVDYEENGVWAFEANVPITVVANGQTLTGINTVTVDSKLDWFEQQTIGITTTLSLDWDTVTYRPGTTDWTASRGGRFDEMHILVIDGEGFITGNAGSILEKHEGLSKATNAVFSVGSASYWRKYLTVNSEFIFGGGQPTGIVTTGFGEDFLLETDTGWDQPADNIIFGAIGANTYTLSGGKNYGGTADVNTAGAFTATIGDLAAGYELFEDTEVGVDFLIMGSAAYRKEDAQALANQLISVAEINKLAVAFISPYRGAILSDTSSQTAINILSSQDATDNIISFYSSIASTTYAVFDSGYKYMYDRFNDTFRYVPLNGDIAGLCARTDINQFPWYSPAGTNRGAILNAVKLPYNPGKLQRDRLYSNRVNSVIYSPGAGIVLFGDKTGYGRVSAFDRINVRRLFIYLEKAISESARDVLFEFNDSLTRQNFINTIEPFLRDVRAKRGIFDYLVVCDERNNTPAVIDNNEFIADIYIKPTRSINFIGLNFIATKTGVAFEEVIGTF